MNAIHAARGPFIVNEFSEKIRRALLHNVRANDVDNLQQDDLVYYKQNGDDRWHGPAVVVIGKDGGQVIVKHGGVYVRVYVDCSMLNIQKIRMLYNNLNLVFLIILMRKMIKYQFWLSLNMNMK